MGMDNILNDSWWHPKTTIKNSTIHGNGLFATENIPANEVIFIAGGTVLSQADFQETKTTTQGLCLPLLGGEFYVVSAKGSQINHSCQPNLIVQGHNTWLTRRNIEQDEELTMDYSTFTDQDKLVIEKCSCRSSRCRSQIRLDDWKKASLQEFYGDHFSPDILEKINRNS